MPSAQEHQLKISAQIFAINTVIPMLGTVYWGGNMPPRFQVAVNVSTLLGSLVGQVLFGILADKYGRRKMYGLELVVTITASLGFAAASPGVNNSMSMIAWLVFWRIIMGAGIGADYPLSAVITAECVVDVPFTREPTHKPIGLHPPSIGLVWWPPSSSSNHSDSCWQR